MVAMNLRYLLKQGNWRWVNMSGLTMTKSVRGHEFGRIEIYLCTKGPDRSWNRIVS